METPGENVVKFVRHWTQILKDENRILISTLQNVQSEVRDIIGSRFVKANQFPRGDSYDLGYLACAQEISLRVSEARDRVLRELREKGIDI